jgi:hypothetical protein
MRNGYNDTLIKIGIELIKDRFFNLKDYDIRLDNKKVNDLSPLEDIQKDIQQIQNIMKIKRVYKGATTTIMNEVNGSKSFSDLVNNKALDVNKS